MDEIALLRRVREDTPGPDAQTLDTARRTLMTRARATGSRPRRQTPRLRVVLAAGAVAAVSGVVVSGVGPWGGGSSKAAAAQFLADASSAATATPSAAPGPGQYLRVTTREKALSYVTDPTGDTVGAYTFPTVSTTWVPHDRAEDWITLRYALAPEAVLGGADVRRAARRDLAESATRSDPEISRYAGGSGGNGELGGGGGDFIGTADLDSLPRDAEDLLAVLSSSPAGTYTSRAEKVMSQVSILLGSGLVGLGIIRRRRKV